MSNYHVTNPKGANGWKVLKEGAGGGKVRIHKPNGGPIRDSDTVSPGRDPNPPKDKKY